MPTLKLFDAAHPELVLEERRLDDGELMVGRVPGPGGWELRDPDRLISRTHCLFNHADGRLTVRDLSVNGVTVDGRAERLPPGEEVPVAAGEVVRLGRLSILVAADAEAAGISPFAPPPGAPPTSSQRQPRSAAFDAPFHRPMLAQIEPMDGTVIVPTEWAEAPTAAPVSDVPRLMPDATLLEAFCAGAKLDLSAFVAEDPRDVMRALGTVYRQMVLGLGDLMAERVTVKTEFRMARTTVRGEGNNPFKWATPHRVAMELLREPAEGFLSGPEAVNECFADLKKHVLCVMAGMRAAVAATVDGLDPDNVPNATPARGLFAVRSTLPDGYRRHHAEFAAQAAQDPDGPVNRAFRYAYEQRLRELDRGRAP
jgi:predicted component of type VI protein secretion system